MWRRTLSFFVNAHRDQVFFLASALSFNALMAAIPFAMLFLGVLGYVFERRTATADDVRIILNFLLPTSTTGSENPLQLTERVIAGVVDSRAQFSRFGVILFLVFAARLFRSARIALDRILGKTRERRWFVGTARDLFLVALTALLFAASTAMMIPALTESWADLILSNVLSVILSAILFFFVYSFAPARKLRTDTIVIAAFFTSFAFEAAKVFFGFYIAEFATLNQAISNANAIGLLLFVAWIYYTAAVFLLGGEFAKAYEGLSLTES